MDIGWYKDNIALQAELKREYPAVAELIDRLMAELEQARQMMVDEIAQAKKDHKTMYDLERQLAHKQEQCDTLAHEVLELEQQLSEARAEVETTQLHLMEEETTRKIWEQDCKKAESQLAEARAEILAMLKEGSMFYDDTTAIEADIAAMEYKEKAND